VSKYEEKPMTRNENKTFFLYGEMYVENGTNINISLNPIAARDIINTLISQLIEGDTPHFTVYGQLVTEGDHLNTGESDT
jgi:hypothetical protein